MKTKNSITIIAMCLGCMTPVYSQANNELSRAAVFTKADSLALSKSQARISAWDRLHVGGYGEVAFSRNFYSDNYLRYSEPGKYKGGARPF